MKGKQDHSLDDNTAYYRGDWNQIEGCDFYKCAMPVALVWTTQRSNFHLCKAVMPFAFASKANMEVGVGISPEEHLFFDDLTAMTSTAGMGQIHLSRANLLPRDKPTPLWKWTDAEKIAVPSN